MQIMKKALIFVDFDDILFTLNTKRFYGEHYGFIRK